MVPHKFAWSGGMQISIRAGTWMVRNYKLKWEFNYQTWVHGDI